MSDQVNYRPDLDQFPRTADELNDERVLLRRQLTASQARVKELEQCLEPGKASAIVNGLFREAERLGFYKPTGEHALSQFVKKVEKDKERIATLEQALRDMFSLIDEGWLIRDTSKDSEPGFAVRQLPFAVKLGRAKQALTTISTAVKDEKP